MFGLNRGTDCDRNDQSKMTAILHHQGIKADSWIGSCLGGGYKLLAVGAEKLFGGWFTGMAIASTVVNRDGRVLLLGNKPKSVVSFWRSVNRISNGMDS